MGTEKRDISFREKVIFLRPHVFYLVDFLVAIIAASSAKIR